MLKKEITRLSTAGVLIVLLFIAIFYNAKGRQPQQHPKDTKNLPSQGQAAARGRNESKSLYLSLEREAEKIELKRDPFSKMLKEVPFALNLNGIVWDQDHPVAIINNEIMTKGSRINGKEVVGIEENKVILTDGHQTIELKLELETQK